MVDHLKKFFLHFWNLRFITSLWIPERTLEVLPSLSYRRLNTRSYKDQKRQQKKSIFNISGQIGRSFRVTKGRGSKKAVVNFPYLQGRLKSRKSEPSLSCALGMKEPVIGSKTSRDGK